MKKFFEAPAVSSVELMQEDVMVESKTIGAANNKISYADAIKDSTASDYTMWKGFNAE